MSNLAIHTDLAPAAIGPYSQAIQAGNTIYVSGQLPINPATGAFAGDDISSQTPISSSPFKGLLYIFLSFKLKICIQSQINCDISLFTLHIDSLLSDD